MSDAADERDRAGVGRWIGLAVGIPIIAYGVVGAVANNATHPVKLAIWIAGADILHDALVAPAVCLAGWLFAKATPRPWRTPIRAALISTGLIVAIGWVPLRGYGRIADNPSLAPLNYATAIPEAIAIVWLACALWIAAVAICRRTKAVRDATALPNAPR